MNKSFTNIYIRHYNHLLCLIRPLLQTIRTDREGVYYKMKSAIKKYKIKINI